MKDLPLTQPFLTKLDSKILVAAVSVSLYTMTTATPIATAVNSTSTVNSTSASNTSSSEPFSLYFDEELAITADDVLVHLEQNGLITWYPAGNGTITQIDESTWSIGIDGAIASLIANSTSVLASSNVSSILNGLASDLQLHKRGVLGTIAGYAARAACYGSGAVDPDSAVANFVGAACDQLINNTLPPLLKNV